MTRDVTIEQDAKGDNPAAPNRRTVLGALSLGLVAAACNAPGAGKSASIDESKKTVKSGTPSEDEIEVALPSRDNPAEETAAPADEAVPSIDAPKTPAGPAKEMPGGGSVPKVGEVKPPPKKPAADPEAPEPKKPEVTESRMK